jgi:DNA-binding transcriptional LysR family regulator
VARTGHPAIGRELELDTYLAQEHILVSSRRHGPSLVDAELNRKGRKRSIVMRCQNYFAACSMAAQTDMLLTMPEHYAEMLNTRFENRLYPFPLKSLQALDIHLWLRDEITKITEEAMKANDPGVKRSAKRASARRG